MELSAIEKTLLDLLNNEELMSLKAIAENIGRTEKISKQRVWNALQLLCAKDLVEKVDKGVYRLSRKK